jgi:aminodeoxyfutalosine deaminase
MQSFIRASAAWTGGNVLRSDAVVVVEEGRVRDILDSRSVPADVSPSYPARLLLPGFINAHCHLEYSYCRGKMTGGEVAFPDWVSELGRTAAATTTGEKMEFAGQAVQELLAGGTTTLVDCTRSDWSAEILHESPLRHVILWEMIGLDAGTGLAAFEKGMRRIDTNARRCPKCVALGLNPHAPYSVGPALRECMRQELRMNPTIVCGWHLSEMAEEMKLFAQGTGAWADFLRAKDLPLPFDKVPATTPTDFIASEGLLDRCDFAFHMNHPASFDFERFAMPRSLVHCPGTHDFFKRTSFPMREYLEAGTSVCLGTDSLASAETLSMLDTIRLAAAEFPALTGPQLLNMATKAPGQNRAFESLPGLGTISPGAPADLVAIETPLPGVADLRTVLSNCETKVAATFVAGKRVF